MPQHQPQLPSLLPQIRISGLSLASTSPFQSFWMLCPHHLLFQHSLLHNSSLRKRKGQEVVGRREGHGIEPRKKGRSGRVDRIMPVYRVLQNMCENEDSGEDDGHRWEQIKWKSVPRCLKWVHLAKRESHQT